MPSSMNNGSDTALTAPRNIGFDNRTEEVPSAASVFDVRYFRKSWPEAKTISPNTMALRTLAPSKGSMPTDPMAASMAGYSGAHATKYLPA